MKAPMIAVGDGALGFWAALRDVFPEAGEERCWVHKIANVLDKLPQELSATGCLLRSIAAVQHLSPDGGAALD